MITCPYDKKTTCGNFANLNEYDLWADKHICKQICEYGKDNMTGYRRRRAAKESGIFNTRARHAFRERLKNTVTHFAFQERVRGRKVA